MPCSEVNTTVTQKDFDVNLMVKWSNLKEN